MSTFDLRRLRRGELIAGASGALLLAFMFGLHWYALSGTLSQTAANVGAKTSYNGWEGLNHLRYLLLVTALVAVGLALFQAAEQAPAIPVTAAVFVTLLGLISALALIYRVLINPPGSASGLDQQAGAYLGLLSALAITYGGYASMRQEQGARIDPDDIETLSVGAPAGS